MKQARVTRHPWLVACDANICPEDFEKRLCFQRELMHVVAPEEATTCRSKGPKGEWIEKTYDCHLRVTASGENFIDEAGGRPLSRGLTRQYPLWSRERERQGDSGME